eukprot:Colp12_sorted_trinity150504_noHs@30825
MTTFKMKYIIGMNALSSELLVHIFSFLDAKSLCQCACVCRLWCELANEPSLWRELYHDSFNKGNLDPLLQRSKDRIRQWKEMFAIKSNWRNGVCSVFTLKKTDVEDKGPVLCLEISKHSHALLAVVHKGAHQATLWNLTKLVHLMDVPAPSVVCCQSFGSGESKDVLAVGTMDGHVMLWGIAQKKASPA